MSRVRDPSPAPSSRRLRPGGQPPIGARDLHESIDQRDFSGADGHHDALASLIADLVRRLSTWPWRPGTAGAVVSAVILPIALWVVTRLMERVL